MTDPLPPEARDDHPVWFLDMPSARCILTRSGVKLDQFAAVALEKAYRTITNPPWTEQRPPFLPSVKDTDDQLGELRLAMFRMGWTKWKDERR